MKRDHTNVGLSDELILGLLGHRYEIDTREQLPLPLVGLPVDRVGLKVGDYGISGYSHEIVVERKSVADLVGSLTRDRERFQRELEKLATFHRAIIVVEGDYTDVADGLYRGAARPTSLIASIASIHSRYGIATLFAGNRTRATHFVRVWLSKNVQRLRLARQEAA